MNPDDRIEQARLEFEKQMRGQSASHPTEDPWEDDANNPAYQRLVQNSDRVLDMNDFLPKSSPPNEVQYWQSEYQELVNRISAGEFSQQPQQAKPAMAQKSIISHPWFWAVVIVGVAAVSGVSLAIAGGQQSAKKPTEQGKEQAIATAPTPTPETVNSSASTVMVTIPGQGFAAAVLAEPTLQEIPGNVAGSLADKQTAELTGRTQDGFSEIKWGDGTKWISTCYTTPEGCSNQKTLGDLR